MNLHDAATPITSSQERHHEAHTHLHGRWLLLARAIWISVVVLTLAIFFASLPIYLAQLQTSCSGSPCAYDQFSPAQVRALQRIGLSLGDYALCMLALTLASVVLCVVVS